MHDLVMHEVGKKDQTSDELKQVETGSGDTTELYEDFPEMTVPLNEHRRGKLNNDHEVTFDLLCICQKCDDTIEPVNSGIPEVAATVHATMMHMSFEGTLTLEEFFQTQD